MVLFVKGKKIVLLSVCYIVFCYLYLDLFISVNVLTTRFDKSGAICFSKKICDAKAFIVALLLIRCVSFDAFNYSFALSNCDLH